MKQTRSSKPRRAPHYVLRVVLVLLGIALVPFCVYSIALWVPFLRPLASHATIWPPIQMGLVVSLGLIGGALWLLHQRRVGIAYTVISLAACLPTATMLIQLHQYASAHGVRVPVSSQVAHMFRDYPASSHSGIVYATVGATTLHLDAYLPPAPAATPSPAVVYMHGGGWSGGSHTESSELYHSLAAQGYAVFSIDYRTSRPGYATWKDAPADVACALAWVREHADDYALNLTRVTVMGDSAGGQLALRTGYGLVNGDVSSSCGGEPVVPASVVGIVPAVDFYSLYDDPLTGSGSRANIVQYLGGTPDQVRERYEYASIAPQVRPGLMPTLIINAEQDNLVSPRTGEALAEKLHAASVPVEQYTLPYAAHSYWINPGGYQNRTAQAMIVRFLEKH